MYYGGNIAPKTHCSNARANLTVAICHYDSDVSLLLTNGRDLCDVYMGFLGAGNLAGRDYLCGGAVVALSAYSYRQCGEYHEPFLSGTDCHGNIGLSYFR